MKIYDGENMILGRLAARAAKDALLGEEVRIVNCEKVVISGKKENTMARAHQRRNLGGYPLKRQTHSRLPDRFVRRSIRGMLPWKLTRGKEAFKRVMCYRGVPAEFSGKEIVSLPNASVKKLPNLRYMTIGELCKMLGGKAQ